MIPFGADRWASCVSSDMWAEASKPVSVYCAFNRPMRPTYSGIPKRSGPGHETGAAAGVVDRLRKDGAQVGSAVLVEEDADEHDRRDADQVPPHRYVVQERHESDPDRVQQGVDDQHDPVDQDQVGRVGREAEGEVQEGVREERQAEVDAGRDGDLADKVEPADEPAPPGAVCAGLIGELGGPVVEAAGGGIARGNLGHAQGNQ